MGLWTPGKLRVSLYVLTQAAIKCRQEHTGSTMEPLITDVVHMDYDHPDNIYARQAGRKQHDLMVEFEYDEEGHRAGYGIGADGIADCFYD